MTDGQIKYQNYVENQRHNLEMERLGAQEASIQQQQADTARMKAEQSEREVKMKEGLFDAELDYAKAKASTEWMKHGWNSIATIFSPVGAMAKLFA